MSPTWSQQTPPRSGTELGKSSRTNSVAARKSSAAKSSEPVAFAPATFSPARATSHLPIEIGFLAHYGVSFARLANVAETARKQAVTADRVLIAEGQISEAFFYRTLARHLRLTFTDADIALNIAAPYPQMIEAGAVASPPGESAAFLVAPRGAAIGHLIDSLNRRGAPANIALTTPSHLSRLSFARLRAVKSRAPRALAFRISTPIFAPKAA